MKATIVLGLAKKNYELSKLENNRIILLSQSEKTAFLYHIENSDVDSYILYPGKDSYNLIDKIIKHIHYLNAMITIIIVTTDSELKKITEKTNIHIISKEYEIAEILTNISKSQRDSNRIQWPLKVTVCKSDDSENNKNEGIVLSISSSGCLIKGDTDIKINKYIFLSKNQFTILSYKL